jgi:hypothetical protein
MDYIIIGSVILLLIIATVLLTIFLPRPKCYYSAAETYKELTALENELIAEKINEELLAYIKKTHKDKLRTKDPYASAWYENGEFSDVNVAEIPRTLDVLETITQIKHVGISKLPPVYSEPVKDADCLTVIFPVMISSTHKSGIWVDGEKKLFKNGVVVIGNTTKKHYFFNEDPYNPSWILIAKVPNISQ